MARHAARVHIILARKAEFAIVIRRGPSKVVCTIGWNLRNNTFEMGQWLKGRIYERRCDLSPDGKLFIYFAFNGKRTSETKGSWTAISKAPFLQAIGLWGNGSGWNGGGLFVSDDSYWLNKFLCSHQELERPRRLKQVEQPSKCYYGGECPGVYYIRLQRDGWKLVQDPKVRQKDEYTLFEKHLWEGWTLIKKAHATTEPPVGAGCYFDTHQLIHHERGQTIDLPEWEWADIYRRRVFWVTKGVLFESSLTAAGLGKTYEIHDFNDMQFAPIKAPYHGS